MRDGQGNAAVPEPKRRKEAEEKEEVQEVKISLDELFAGEFSRPLSLHRLQQLTLLYRYSALRRLAPHPARLAALPLSHAFSRLIPLRPLPRPFLPLPSLLALLITHRHPPRAEHHKPLPFRLIVRRANVQRLLRGASSSGRGTRRSRREGSAGEEGREGARGHGQHGFRAEGGREGAEKGGGVDEQKRQMHSDAKGRVDQQKRTMQQQAASRSFASLV